MTDTDALWALAEGLQTLAGKLSEVQAVQASKAAASSLAWAAKDDEAVEWAQARVALSHRAADQDGNDPANAPVVKRRANPIF